MRKIISQIYILSFFIFCNACITKSSKEETPVPESSNLGNFVLHIHSKLDSLDIKKLDSSYTLANGDEIMVKEAQLYISNIRLLKSDGTEIPIMGKPILVSSNQELYKTGQILAGNYRGLRFDIGYKRNTEKIEDFELEQSMWYKGLVGQGMPIQFRFQGSLSKPQSQKPISFNFIVCSENPLKGYQLENRSIFVIPNRSSIVHLNINFHQLLHEVDLGSSDSLELSPENQNEILRTSLIEALAKVVFPEN